MNDLNVVKFLRSFTNVREGLTELENGYGVKAKIYDNFFLLNYSQIESPKNHPITNECRGLILDWKLNVLRRPFDRFYNYGEADTQNFDFTKSSCLEKVDGSLIPVWWNNFEKRWCFGTRGTAFAESECNSGRLFIEVINGCFHDDSKESVADIVFRKGWTYIFELCSPENRVVVPHTETYLVLLGVRNNTSGEYININHMIKCVREMRSYGVNVRIPMVYSITNLDAVSNTFADSGAFFEGYVFWNTETNERVKVKNPAYVAIHHLRDNGNLNPKRVCELVRNNEHEEYLIYFDSDRGFFTPYIEKHNVVLEEIENIFNTLSVIENQKDFAIEALKTKYSNILFLKKKCPDVEISELLKKINIQTYINLVS